MSLCHVPWPPGTRLRHRVTGERAEVLDLPRTVEWTDMRLVLCAFEWEEENHFAWTGTIEEDYELVGDWPRPWLRSEREERRA